MAFGERERNPCRYVTKGDNDRLLLSRWLHISHKTTVFVFKGGHTRSVHSRHDKAEKQWTEMANRLGRGYGYRPKERIKVRTRELERLLVCVEDAGEPCVHIFVV